MNAERRALWSLRIALPAAAWFTMAGGLGLAFTAALAGLSAAPLRAARRALFRPGLALALSVAAIGWLALSYLWSAYDRPDQALKLVLLTPLFALIPLAASGLGPHTRDQARVYAVFATALALVYFFVETITAGSAAVSYKIAVEGYEADAPETAVLALRTLSRGATAALMLAGPVALMLWRRETPAMRFVAVWIMVLAVIAAAGFDVEANLLALCAGLATGALALAAPRRALQLILIGAAIFVLFAPLIMSALLALIGPELRESLPLTWVWRLEIWDHVVALIAQRPLLGHGLDAARVIDDTTILRGQEIELLPLHAHNAALHIWLEAGAIGAALIAGALAAMARAVERRSPDRDVSAGVAYVLGVWLATVMVGYGVWQEWHHGALALAIAVAMLLEGAREPV